MKSLVSKAALKDIKRIYISEESLKNLTRISNKSGENLVRKKAICKLMYYRTPALGCAVVVRSKVSGFCIGMATVGRRRWTLKSTQEVSGGNSSSSSICKL